MSVEWFGKQLLGKFYDVDENDVMRHSAFRSPFLFLASSVWHSGLSLIT